MGSVVALKIELLRLQEERAALKRAIREADVHLCLALEPSVVNTASIIVSYIRFARESKEKS